MEFSIANLQPKERASFALRALYEAAGCRKYHMGRFEEYGLYQENRSFCLLYTSAKQMDAKKTAQQVLEQVGGAENVTFLTHCVTRLRFNLKSMDGVDEAKVKAVPGVCLLYTSSSDGGSDCS